ncbi:MAG: 16S rRNA (cytidine(1402)-2'-O)-methyltransferase [Chloroflexota bacterium]|nr:16S rRNA (cytidine(1402)-2'-O)-methyltransferase [Chloroflexota bacterium]MXW28164.1 16S rRNA (cytidine(1402)-2'-O)-methyltransferase [Chloroflexota bacterium]
MGTLFVVATPIGNLEDISPRSQAVLESAAVIYAEDTRRTRKLLTHLGIRNRPLSLHGDSADSAWRDAAAALADGDVAYVTDGGTPAVADPGARLVRLAHERGHPVRTVPGPSAVTAALAVAGLESGGHVFLGFLPPRRSRRMQLLESAIATNLPMVVFAGPHDLSELLAELADLLGPQAGVVVCHELTKLHERVVRTTLGQAPGLDVVSQGRGEKTLVLDPPQKPAAPPPESQLRLELAQLQDSGLSPSRAARELAARHRLPKDVIYRLVVDSDRN